MDKNSATISADELRELRIQGLAWLIAVAIDKECDAHSLVFGTEASCVKDGEPWDCATCSMILTYALAEAVIDGVITRAEVGLEEE